MSYALNYEGFVRLAFGYNSNEHTFNMVNRGKDLASLADTDIFNNSYVNQVKTATAYSMYIFTNEIYNYSQLIQDNFDTESDRIDAIINSVLIANDVMSIHNLIEKFKNTVLNKYFLNNQGHHILRT